MGTIPLDVPLVPAINKEGITSRVRSIRSEGGGIFTYTALLVAAKTVEQSDKGTRHIVIFADAADAVGAAFLSLLRKGPDLDGAPPFAWLLTAVIRIADAPTGTAPLSICLLLSVYM